ncbi:carbohydrate deacetylase [Candidatus Uabimicrobium sp. HlEnr_7]|uniref:carbohydrate deacetylase n=1 Tax=Candidatus Uabimicrobium helgolandensis TaxID=3095367 RepID=UPI003558E00B
MKLIINADDFGLTESVNQAIIDVFQAGNLTSTTLMVNMPGATHAIELAKQNPLLAVGLHFNITEGRPLSSASSIVDSHGKFYSRSVLTKLILQGKVHKQDIEQELQAQINKFRSFDLPLSHVDSHQHIHMLPFVCKSIVPTLMQKKITVRVVDPVYDLSLLTKRPLKWIKQYLNQRFAKKFKRIFSGKVNDKLISIHDLKGGVITTSTYRDLLSSCQGVVELMVHPYILGDDLLELYKEQPTKMAFLKKCELEHQILTQEKIFTIYKVIHYGNI